MIVSIDRLRRAVIGIKIVNEGRWKERNIQKNDPSSGTEAKDRLHTLGGRIIIIGFSDKIGLVKKPKVSEKTVLGIIELPH